MIKKLYLLLIIAFSFSVANAQTYCVPNYSFAPFGCSDINGGDVINNFSTTGGLTNITNNGSGCNGDYTYFSTMGASQIQGLAVNLSMQCGPTYSEGFRVWIDYNNDGDFQDLDEAVFVSTGASLAVQTGTFTVPVATTPGLKRMRVLCRFNVVPALTDDCNLAMSYGECEDYNFTVIANTPCTGTPTAGTTVASNVNPCPGTSVFMSLTGASLTAGLLYNWQISTNPAGTWTNIGAGNGNSTYTTPSITGGQSNCYRCIVTCSSSGLQAISTPVCLTAQNWSPLSSCYCNTSQANNVGDGEISNVSLGTLNNTTDCATPLVGSQGTGTGIANQYADFTSITPPSIYKGLATNVSITSNSCGANNFSMGFKIYIDLNHNASFADPGEEIFFSGVAPVNCSPATVVSGSITIPTSALTGVTRMRVIDMQGGYVAATTITPCGSYNYGETEDYLVNIINPAAQDPTVTAIAGPSLNCFTTCETVTATVSNYGSLPINVLSNPINVTLHVNGPNGVTTYTQAVTAATLNAYAGNSTPVVFPCVDMYGGGLYSLNTTLTMGNAGGAVNGIVMNDSLPSGALFGNYRPVPGADMHICKDAPIGIGQGLLVSGCGNTIYDSVEIVFNVTPTPDNLGAQAAFGGTGQTLATQACANEFAGNFANAIMPALPTSNPIFTQNAVMTVTNFSTSFPTEPRFVLYKGPNNPIPNPTANANPTSMIFNPCTQGYNVNAGNITLAGQSSLMSAGVYKNIRHITPTQLSNLFSNLPAGQTLNVGYWETYNDNVSTSDINVNAGGNLTTVKLKIYYSYIPSKINWYDNATSTTVLDTIAPYNPLSPTPGYPATTQLSNTSVPGTYTFYATCDGPDCRVPVNLIIDPSPSAFQDTVSLCEDAPGSNQGIFYLCGISGPVSGYASGVTVSYYQDQSLISLLQYCYDTTSTAYIYSKVLNSTTGCYGTDTVLLQATPLPEFSSPVYTGTACAPATFDVANALYFSNVPTGTDTLYFEDMACTIPHLNPHAIAVADTVYVVFKTNTTPACTDTAVAYIDISPAQNLIASQAPGNYSFQGPIPPVTYNFLDGVSNTYYQSSDCKKVAMITDVTNGISLGSTIVNEDINNGALDHNGQPYANRVYQITPTTQDSAQVCLYYLQDDIDTYNGAPLAGLYPTLDATTFCITKTDNGDVNTPGHTFTVIPNSAITSSYDAATTVWTLCFMVDSFSYFYLHTQNPNNVALPISLLSFTGKRVENSSLLKWTTTAEQNNAYFEIERSKDARNFNVVSEKIATKAINGNSNTTLNYSFTDMIPNEGHNYYRLKQTDKDGKTTNAKNVIDVYFGDETMVTLYPNPVQSELNIDINISKATNAKMKIMDATGRVVKQIDMQLKAGGNQTKISLDGLSDGMYMVNITNEKGFNYSQTIRKN